MNRLLSFTCLPLSLGLATASLAAEPNSTPFVVQQDGWFRTLDVNYHEGPRYAHLVRLPGMPDMLAKIMAPHTSP